MGKRALTPLARHLRLNETDAERNLWSRLRNKQIEGAKFRRQQFMGPYIVDFVSLEKKLVIEIDGGQHNKDESRETDEKRTEWLKEIGYEVLRFWDNEVLTNIEGVLEKIKEALV
jgi:very-short-patch-repair endonuclease